MSAKVKRSANAGVLIAASGLVLAFLLTSCSVVRSTRPVVKIGLVGPFEGQFRYVGYDAIYAVRLALREANAHGGAEGKTVELVAYDDQGTVAGARVAARNLVMDPQVVAVIGHFRNETTEAAQGIYERSGLPLVVAGTVEGPSYEQPELLCVLLNHLGQTLQREGEKQAQPQVQWIAADVLETEECAKGVQITMGNGISPASDVGAIVLPMDPVAAGKVLAELRATGWRGVIAGGSALGSPLFARSADPSGVIFVSANRWPDVEGQDASFSAAYQSLGPHISPPGPFALSSYQAAQTLLVAIEAASRTERAPTRDALTQILDLSQKPQSMSAYVYRWTSTGTLELIGEESVEIAE